MGLRSSLRKAFRISAGMASGGTSELFYFQPKEIAEKAEEQAALAQKQAKISQAVSGLKAQRERAQQLRQQRVIRGQVEAQGQVSGTTASSGIAGGVAGLQSTTASNLGFSLGTQQASEDIFTLGTRIFNIERKKQRQMTNLSIGQNLFDLGTKAATGGV